MKPNRGSNKNDHLDAEAIAEAVTRKKLRLVPIKTEDKLDVQGLHRVRERLVHNRTEVINQIRGFLLERGVTFNRGPRSLREGMPDEVDSGRCCVAVMQPTESRQRRDLAAHRDTGSVVRPPGVSFPSPR